MFSHEFTRVLNKIELDFVTPAPGSVSGTSEDCRPLPAHHTTTGFRFFGRRWDETHFTVFTTFSIPIEPEKSGSYRRQGRWSEFKLAMPLNELHWPELFIRVQRPAMSSVRLGAVVFEVTAEDEELGFRVSPNLTLSSSMLRTRMGFEWSTYCGTPRADCLMIADAWIWSSQKVDSTIPMTF